MLDDRLKLLAKVEWHLDELSSRVGVIVATSLDKAGVRGIIDEELSLLLLMGICSLISTPFSAAMRSSYKLMTN
jgi:hypothetical protein